MATKLDILAVGAHPDDVELCVGGTLALQAQAGCKVGILHLTSGEAGTRGTPEKRRQEAEKAAEILGVEHVEFLDFGDGSFRTGEAEEDILIECLRRLRPELVIGPAPTDRHPDHTRAHLLVRDAAFYAGLARRGSGEPHRPAAVFSFMQHYQFDPAFLVDVSATWAVKIAALHAYESQLYSPDRDDDGPETKVSSPEFWAAIEGRGAHFGLMINAAYAEPFWSPTPLAVDDLMALLPGGIR
jgi:bacillithiol biosynthesis deacetylase BshB1